MDARRPGYTVLIVEDEVDLAVSCARLLRRAGYEAAIAPDGAAALRRLDAEPPDLVLTDLRLPGADGLTVLRRARRGGIPVILISAYATPDTCAQALAEGAAACLAKPFSGAELRAAVARVLDAAPSGRAPGAAGVPAGGDGRAPASRATVPASGPEPASGSSVVAPAPGERAGSARDGAG